LEHTEVLGETREQIAQEKLAVAHAARVVVMSDNRFDQLVPAGPEIIRGGAREAAEAFFGKPISTPVEVALPGRLERRGQAVSDPHEALARARALGGSVLVTGSLYLLADLYS